MSGHSANQTGNLTPSLPFNPTPPTPEDDGNHPDWTYSLQKMGRLLGEQRAAKSETWTALQRSLGQASASEYRLGGRDRISIAVGVTIVENMCCWPHSHGMSRSVGQQSAKSAFHSHLSLQLLGSRVSEHALVCVKTAIVSHVGHPHSTRNLGESAL